MRVMFPHNPASPLDPLQRGLTVWLELFRLPNLFSVPGDVLGGLCLAAGLTGNLIPIGTAALTLAASLACYAGGLLQNDLTDEAEDRFHRPERPLPSRRVSRNAVLAAWLACLVISLLAGALAGRKILLGVLGLQGLVTLYNLHLKKTLYYGSLAMGLCRGMNLFLGTLLIGWHPLLLAAIATETLFITAVTVQADSENRKVIPGREVYLPAIMLLLGGTAMLATQMRLFAALPWMVRWSAGCCLGLAVLNALMAGLQISNRSVLPEEMQACIGKLLRSLFPWQASLVALQGTAAALDFAIILLCFWPLSWSLGRRYASS